MFDFVNYLILYLPPPLHYHARMLPRPKRRPRAEGATLRLLQRQLERFSGARLDRAMQQAWRKEYDPKEFFSVAIPDHGAVLHAFGAEIAIRHNAYPLDWKSLGDAPLPFWAAHSACTILEYRCPQKPEDETRRRMYRGLGMLAAELASPHTAAFFFDCEQVLLPNSVEVLEALRAPGPLDPHNLESLADQ